MKSRWVLGCSNNVMLSSLNSKMNVAVWSEGQREVNLDAKVNQPGAHLNIM